MSVNEFGADGGSMLVRMFVATLALLALLGCAASAGRVGVLSGGKPRSYKLVAAPGDDGAPRPSGDRPARLARHAGADGQHVGAVLSRGPTRVRRHLPGGRLALLGDRPVQPPRRHRRGLSGGCGGGRRRQNSGRPCAHHRRRFLERRLHGPGARLLGPCASGGRRRDRIGFGRVGGRFLQTGCRGSVPADRGNRRPGRPRQWHRHGRGAHPAGE